jgi:L-ribulose-5-phosphate 4-epimerase
MGETGYVKYQCNWINSEPIDSELIKTLNLWRDKLYTLGFIGVYPNGIGYGNLSIRLHNRLFLITGTATGGIKTLTNEHYTTVTDYSFEHNSLTCHGSIKASAESLTHAAVYESAVEANAVIHIHSKALWDKLINQVPTTSAGVEYGTPQMALEIKRLFKETNLNEQKILVMAGHEEGIVSFGSDLEEAGNIILKNNYR